MTSGTRIEPDTFSVVVLNPNRYATTARLKHV